jgi:hypothetical protein
MPLRGLPGPVARAATNAANITCGNILPRILIIKSGVQHDSN